jgi:LacI family transcriptional regulator
MLGVSHCAAAAGWHLDVQKSLENDPFGEWHGDGVIAWPTEAREDLSDLIVRSPCPVVVMNLNVPSIHTHRFDFDSHALGRLAAAHFVDRAFTYSAWYSPGASKAEQIRCQSFGDAVIEAGLDFVDLTWILRIGKRKDTWDNRESFLRRELAKLRKPVAVFCRDDSAAVEVIEACREMDLAIPDEVAVLGCGDMPLFRESTTIPLSSIQVDFDRLAREACELLGRLMDGAEIPRETHLLPPGDIVARRSTDTIAAQSTEVAGAIRFMFDHLAEPIGVADISRASGISTTGLYVKFRKEHKQSPAQLLARIRLDKAKEMLRQTRESVSVISERCGFGNPVNLHRRFRLDLKTTPRRYREESRRAKNSSGRAETSDTDKAIKRVV